MRGRHPSVIDVENLRLTLAKKRGKWECNRTIISKNYVRGRCSNLTAEERVFVLYFLNLILFLYFCRVYTIIRYI